MSFPVREHAEATMATNLADYCRRYEEQNKSVIDDFADDSSEDELSSHGSESSCCTCGTSFLLLQLPLVVE
jgi:hypothetical protein